MNSTHDRMKAVVAALGFTSNAAFEEAVGLGIGFVSRIKSTVTSRSLQKIVAKFPQVNVHYITTGQGEMFGTTPAKTDSSTVRERFNAYLQYKGIKRADFISSTGVYNTFPKEVDSFSASIKYRINAIYPDFNLDWLLTGIGEMLQESSDLEGLTTYKQRLGIFCKQQGISQSFFLIKTKSTRTTFAALPKLISDKYKKDIALAFPQLNIEWVETGKGDMLNNDITIANEISIISIPLVPQRAYAGYLSGFADDFYISKLPTIPMVKQDNEKYIAFEISGDSMDDGSSLAYQDSDIVICRLCQEYYFKQNMINYNKKEFVIVHKDGILLKRITNIDFEGGFMQLHSFNPIYNDLRLKLADVRQILEVIFQQKRRL